MRRIEDYALLGDLQSAALVGRDGSIDWCCFPRFDSDACFAALLGLPEHGRWLLAPANEVRRVNRGYRPGTLILESTFVTATGSVRATDFMPPRVETPTIVRLAEGLTGGVAMGAERVVRPDVGRVTPWGRELDGAVTAIAGPDAFCLRTTAGGRRTPE